MEYESLCSQEADISSLCAILLEVIWSIDVQGEA
jgi:hypothetical protein